MAISKKHFEAIAKAIKETKSDRQSHHPAKPNVDWAIDRLSLRLAKAFSEFNPNFDAVRFTQAAEVQEWVIDRAIAAELKSDQPTDQALLKLSQARIWQIINSIK
tara:strand:- start:169 stop:483 length:315 start_codon:yes stop_codon:yes gene_type:complete